MGAEPASEISSLLNLDEINSKRRRMFHQWRTQEFCSGGGGSTNSVEDRGQRERESGGGSPLVRGSGGSCNLVQEISFHIVKFPYFLVFKTIYDDNQFICHC